MQSITLEHYSEIFTYLLEDVWFDVNHYNYYRLVHPYETHNFYTECIQAY